MGKALDAAEKLSEGDDEMEMIYFMRGAMHERSKDFDSAEKFFRKVLEMNPENSSALNYLGYMLADRNVRLQEAHDLVKKALDLEPNNGAYLDSLGWIYYRMDRLPEAETYLRRALERYSRDPVVNDHLGDVYFKQGKLKEAIAQWQAALKEWESASKAELDPKAIAETQRKLESAKVRLAKEGGNSGSNRP
jgi:Flp pilus assembly protein TadD